MSRRVTGVLTAATDAGDLRAGDVLRFALARFLAARQRSVVRVPAV